MPIPNIIEPSSRTVIGESPREIGCVDEDVTVQVCSTMRGGVSVLYRLSQCQELIMEVIRFRNQVHLQKGASRNKMSYDHARNRRIA